MRGGAWKIGSLRCNHATPPKAPTKDNNRASALLLSSSSTAGNQCIVPAVVRIITPSGGGELICAPGDCPIPNERPRYVCARVGVCTHNFGFVTARHLRFESGTLAQSAIFSEGSYFTTPAGLVALERAGRQAGSSGGVVLIGRGLGPPWPCATSEPQTAIPPAGSVFFFWSLSLGRRRRLRRETDNTPLPQLR